MELNKIQTLGGNHIDIDVEFHLKGEFCSKNLNASDLFHTGLGYYILYYILLIQYIKY